ncbi:MAG TPA: group III truncated hemoglobin [Cytophagaceae bacterium]|jgi:hemoglobin
MESNKQHDIETEADVKIMVDTFYDKVNSDDLLASIFNDFAEVDWTHHLPQMYMFWNHIILGISGYRGQPFPKHLRLPISKEHFERWLALFTENIDAQFFGPKTEMAKARANKIAQVFQHKMDLI